MSITPYTYYLYHIPTGKKYYGVRQAPVAPPCEDFWTHYFTSSKKVKAMIATYGKESFRWEIRKTFSSRVDALLWEQQVLRRLHVKDREDWLNHGTYMDYLRSYGDTPRRPTPKSKRLRGEWIRRRRLRKLGLLPPLTPCPKSLKVSINGRVKHMTPRRRRRARLEGIRRRRLAKIAARG